MRRKMAVICLIGFLFMAMSFAAFSSKASRQAPMQVYDILIMGGRIVDGTGAPWFLGDLGIMADCIQAVGNLRGAHARQTINATGLVVAPGFIDMQGQSEFNVLVDNRAASKITQGVTTEITGEGIAIAPVNDRLVEESQPMYQRYGVKHDWRTLDEYFAHFLRIKSAINIGTFVGAGGLRSIVVGDRDRPATPAELEQMRRLLGQAMEDGALGLSSALQYVPDRFASTEEIVELAKLVVSMGGLCCGMEK